ncbi:MAG: glycosyl hydrolase 53 family protein [Firmicutes bacterium]|nr:glycosyl hydrolase 53 family protein [Bacillota bacterium]
MSGKTFLAVPFMVLSLVLIIFFALNSSSPNLNAATFAKGADVGWLSQMEASGYKFYNDSGAQQDCLQILKDHGINSIRFRVWVNPTGGWCGKTDVVNMAVRAKNMGFRIMIDFHYSDSWADPGKQTKPAAWATHTFSQLLTDVYNHTYDVMNTLKTNGVYPEWVQVGNEINDGMLWEDGRASKSFSNLAQLINKGYDAVKAVNSGSKVIIHLSNGYDNSLFRWMFDGLKNNGAKFDVIGMSLYPSTTDWSTKNSQCLSNMNDMAARYGKEVMICEVGMDYNAASTCKSFLTDIINKTMSVSNGKGLGVFYWEPECYNWQGYTKGAWDTNGRPTIALDAFLGGSATPTPARPGPNLVTNPGFEANGAATQTPSGWSTSGTADADKTEGSAHSGSYKLTHWYGSAYTVTTYQLKTGLTNGTYTLKAWILNGGGQSACRIYAKNYGGAEMTCNLPVTGAWTQVQITGINVTNGQCEIGLYSSANANNWCNMDDVEFYKN